MEQRQPGTPRFVSVDAMRGLTVAAMIFVNNPGDWSHIFGPFGHASWHGVTPTDIIFPTFLFIVGVSLALAAGPKLEAGADMAALQRAWWWRALRIVLLGWVLAAIAVAMLPTAPDDPIPWRPLGVLPRIGICFGLVGWFYLHSSSRLRWWAFAGLLAVYAALLIAWGDLTRDHSLPSRVDALLLGHFAYHYNGATGLGYDPEGILSTLGALASTLFGTQCGDWLRRQQLRPIVLTGAGFAAAGLLLHWAWVLPGGSRWAPPAALHAALGWLPINKALWTPPFVLFAGGLSALALVVVHGLIEEWHLPPIGRRFGVNAITAYAGSILMVCLLDGTPLHGWIYGHDLAWMIPYVGEKVPSHLYALMNVLVFWLIVYWMDRRRIKLSI